MSGDNGNTPGAPAPVPGSEFANTSFRDMENVILGIGTRTGLTQVDNVQREEKKHQTPAGGAASTGTPPETPDAQTLTVAATEFSTLRDEFAAMATGITEEVERLTGPGGPWSGPAADAFASGMSTLAEQLTSCANILHGETGAGFPESLAANAADLSIAIADANQIDRTLGTYLQNLDTWYAGWHRLPLEHGEYETAYTLAENSATERLRQVLVELASSYDQTTAGQSLAEPPQIADPFQSGGGGANGPTPPPGSGGGAGGGAHGMPPPPGSGGGAGEGAHGPTPPPGSGGGAGGGSDLSKLGSGLGGGGGSTNLPRPPTFSNADIGLGGPPAFGGSGGSGSSEDFATGGHSGGAGSAGLPHFVVPNGLAGGPAGAGSSGGGLGGAGLGDGGAISLPAPSGNIGAGLPGLHTVRPAVMPGFLPAPPQLGRFGASPGSGSKGVGAGTPAGLGAGDLPTGGLPAAGGDEALPALPTSSSGPVEGALPLTPISSSGPAGEVVPPGEATLGAAVPAGGPPGGGSGMPFLPGGMGGSGATPPGGEPSAASGLIAKDDDAWRAASGGGPEPDDSLPETPSGGAELNLPGAGGMPYLPMGGAAQQNANVGERSDASGLLRGDAKPWAAEAGTAPEPGTEPGAARLNLPQAEGVTPAKKPVRVENASAEPVAPEARGVTPTDEALLWSTDLALLMPLLFQASGFGLAGAAAARAGEPVMPTWRPGLAAPAPGEVRPTEALTAAEAKARLEARLALAEQEAAAQEAAEAAAEPDRGVAALLTEDESAWGVPGNRDPLG